MRVALVITEEAFSEPTTHAAAWGRAPEGDGPEVTVPGLARDGDRCTQCNWSWYFSAMRTTIDAAGRLVVPKALRDQLSLTAGQEVDLVVRNGRLEVEPAATRMHLVEDGAGLRAVPEVDLPPLTAEQVRQTLEQARR